MKYEAPFGSSDPNAAYVMGNPSTGASGSCPPAAAFEYRQREIVNFITDSGMTATDSDLHQLSEGMQSAAVCYGVDTGSVNAMAVTLTPAPLKYYTGMTIRVKVGNSNTGPMTINVNNLGIVNVKRGNGAALASGDINAGMVAQLCFDGTNFQVTNFAGFSATTQNNNTYNINIPYIADTGAVNALVATFSPSVGSYTAGLTVEVKVAYTNTGAATINCNGIGAVPIIDQYGNALVAGMLPAGAIILLIYDTGTSSFRFSRFVPRHYSWDLSSPPGSDTALAYPEDSATITFTNVTSIPLKIASVPGRYRVEFLITGTSSVDINAGFFANNTDYGAGGWTSQHVNNSGGGSTSWGDNGGAWFDLNSGSAPQDGGPFMLDLDISTVTAAKFISASAGLFGGPMIGSAFWSDTTTAWTSLGTLIVTNDGSNPLLTGADHATLSGVVTVKRIF